MEPEHLPAAADNLQSMLAHVLCRKILLGFIGQWGRIQKNLPADKMATNINWKLIYLDLLLNCML